MGARGTEERESGGGTPGITGHRRAARRPLDEWLGRLPAPLVLAVRRRPMRLLGLAMGVTMGLMLAIALLMGHTFRQVERTQGARLELERAIGDLRYLDEALTATTRLAGLTGDTRLKTRYDSLGQELDLTMARIRDLTPGSDAALNTSELTAANDTLVRIEREAFRQLERGRRDSATALLGGTRYAGAKDAYRRGSMRLADTLALQIATTTRESGRRIDFARAMSAGSIALVAITWLFLVALLHDYFIAQRRRELELEEARLAAEAGNQAKSAFLANMSHELRTPIGAVIGFANLLGKNKRGNLMAQDLEFLGRIQTNGKHLLALINELLDLAKIESGQMEITLAPTRLDRIIHDSAAIVEGRLEGKDVQLVVDVPAEAFSLETDGIRLKQVLINLVGNAVKFTDQGRVTVRLVPEAGAERARIDVVDSGVGIPADRLEAIFRPFEQADNSSARTHEGTGLGLAIARSLCEALGCTLSVTSVVGQGSTFTVLLPPGLHRSAADDSPSDEQAVPASGAVADRVVLVIDDDPDARLLIGQMVSDAGARPVLASSGEEGLRLARELRPDVITLDLVMPGLGGIDVLHRMKADPMLSGIPVIVVSTDADRHGALLGTVDALAKPVDRDALLRTLARCAGAGGRAAGRVLVVEDDEHTRNLLVEELRAEGVGDVRPTTNGREALAMMERFTPDLILLDLLMPEMDGITFLRTLRLDLRWLAVPVVVVTGRELSRGEERLLEREVLGILRKGDAVDVRLRDLLRTTVLERARSTATTGAGHRATGR